MALSSPAEQPRACFLVPSTRGLAAWAFYDWASSAFPTIVQTFVFAAYFTTQVAEDPATGASQWGWAAGAAGLVVALGGPILGAIADQAGRLKPWIGGFTLLCAASTALLWFVRPAPNQVVLGLLLVAVGTIASEFAELFYNAMLPGLAPRDRIGRWSGWAWGLGYAGGLACLLTVLFAFVSENAWLTFDRSEAAQVRIAFPFVALWLIVFSLPFFLFTPDVAPSHQSLRSALRAGLRQLAESIQNIRQFGAIVRFLIGRMIFIDGLATLFMFGGVYAAGEFGLSTSHILWFGIALNITAGVGAFGFAWIDDRLGGKRTIVASLIGLIVCGMAILAVTEVLLFWGFGLALGIFVGPVQSAGRSYLARVAPAHLRSQTFGLYALSGRATAFLGPLAVAWLTGATGSQRIGMSVIVVLFAAGLTILWGLPADTPGTSADRDDAPSSAE
jgi:UMF1 family MFS transporter